MSELKEKQTVLAVAAATTVALTCMLGVFSQRTKIKSGINVVRKFELEEGNPWLDQGCYDVITAICDAFMPSIKPAELTVDKVNAAADAIHPDLRHFCVRVDQTLIEQHRAYLCRGAIDLNLHSVIAEVLEKLITKEERLQVWLMLKVLSNSAGCFMVTGNPAPFQDLPLQLRVQALATLRDSPVTQLRMFYQTFKRVTGNLFFSYVAEHGTANPGWKSVNYKPEETVGKGRAAVSEEEKGEEKERDRLLREKVNYPSAYNNLTAGKFVAVPTSADADATDVLECDVVVVGSGSGGGMMAAELAKAGLNVVVLEKGGFYRAEEFKTWRESEAFLHTFEKGGLCSTVDGNVLVLAGSCVGGGSTINWSASFRTPEVVTQDWAAQGIPQFRIGGEFDASLDAVHGLLKVNTDQSFRTPSEDREVQRARAGSGKCGSGNGGGGSGKGECGSGGSGKGECGSGGSNKSNGGGCGGGKCGTGAAAPFAINGNNTALWEGAEKLGFRPEKIPRNVQGCVDCGHCCHGCPYGSKQSTQTALFEPLLLDERYKLEVIPHCTVKRVLYEDHEGSVAGADGTRHASHKRAVGVEAEVQVYPSNLADMTVAERLRCIEKFKGRVRKVLVKAKVVVAAAGSIHTPALLLRSGITHRGMVGQHLALHPVLGCGGMFPGVETGLASGVSMGVVVRQPRVTATHDFSKHASMHTSTSEPIGNERFAAAMQTPPGHIGLMGLLFPWAGPGNGSGGVSGVGGSGSGGGGGSGVSGSSSKSVKNGAFSGYGGGLSTKLGLLNWRHSCVFIALPRDQSQASNRVSIDSAGNPVLHYTVTAQDTALMMAGLEANLRFMRSAGAKFLYLAHENFPWFHCGTNTSSASSRSVSSSVSPRSSAKTANANTTTNASTSATNTSTTSTSTRTCTSPTNMNHTPFSADPEFESYIQQIRDHGLHTAKMQIFSAHQMSSCRMAPSPLTGPTSATGELYECMNLYVADGSVLPTSLGINPMVTIESFAHMISKNVIKRACEDVEVRGRVGKFAESGKW